MEIIALQEYTDKYVSLYEGEIRNISDDLANKLIEQGIVAEHDEITPGGGGDAGSGITMVKLFLAIDGGDKEIGWDSTETLRFNDLIEKLENNQYVIAKIDYNGTIEYGLCTAYSKNYSIAFKLGYDANITKFTLNVDNTFTIQS